MNLAAAVIYVDDVPPVLAFHLRAFDIGTRFVVLDVDLPGRGRERGWTAR